MEHLCLSIIFLDARFHGRVNKGQAEWPPSPLRLFQAIVAANGQHLEGEVEGALRWLEGQPPPVIITPAIEFAAPYELSVPNNAMDIVGKAWSKGNYFGRGDANPATHRTMKPVRPLRMIGGDTVHYVWDSDGLMNVDVLIHAAKRIFRLGWGIDTVIADCRMMSAIDVGKLPGQRWTPVQNGYNELRLPTTGSLDALRARYESFLGRVSQSGLAPVSPLTEFGVIGYRQTNAAAVRPHVTFELRGKDSEFFRYPQRKLIHIAGMVRHLAIEMMRRSPPRDISNLDDWLDRYVAGHLRQEKSGGNHRQLSYVPLPTIGHLHADHGVRRVMIAAPPGDHRLLEHLAMRLHGLQLIPKRGEEFPDPPTLVRVNSDNVIRCYTSSAGSWTSVTPIILPGHDDRKEAKTERLVRTALTQCGISARCEFECRSVSRIPRSPLPQEYIRPRHLPTQTAIHLDLKFDDPVSGPILIGAGRHRGFGLMRAVS